MTKRIPKGSRGGPGSSLLRAMPWYVPPQRPKAARNRHAARFLDPVPSIRVREPKEREGCEHHQRSVQRRWGRQLVLVIPLHAEPKGTNPPKLIGYACRRCSLIMTTAMAPSAPKVQRVRNGPLRVSRAHAARLRAADRAGISVRGYQGEALEVVLKEAA